MKNGIFTSIAAGSNTDVAPWTLSVAASTTDRKFLTKLHLGNNMSFEGVTINIFNDTVNYPLVYAFDVAAIPGSNDSRSCGPNSLDPKLAKGTIVLCDAYSIEGPLDVGSAGTIMQDSGSKDSAKTFLIPASYLGSDDGVKVYNYINKTSKPTATIFKSTESNRSSAPFVASFSSRGPNPVTRDILKPDLAAPGVEILAAWL